MITKPILKVPPQMESLNVVQNQVNRLRIPELEMYLIGALPSFSCKRCAKCCKGKIIPLYQRDIERIKTCVKEKFYERTTGMERSITGARYKMLLKKSRCTFLNAGLCKYYDVRPNTCRRHPFLVTERHLLASATCPGIDWKSNMVQESTKEYLKLSSEIAVSIDSFLRRTYLI